MPKNRTKGGYPTLAAAATAIQERLDDPQLEIRSVEIKFLASGEAAYRVQPTMEGEPIGGVVDLRGASG